MSAHAILSPSSAARWLRCPGSVGLCRFLDDKTSEYADEGTRAHELAAKILKGGSEEGADLEMLSYVDVYTDIIQESAKGAVLLVEQSIDISPWTGEANAKGTADAIIVHGNTIEVHDLKYGQGHLVEAVENEQLQLYALGAIDLVETLTSAQITEVRLFIHQPRRDHLSVWTMTRNQLAVFGEKVRAVAAEALAGNGALNPSDVACLWCPAKATCPALQQKVHNEVFGEFKNLEEGLPSPGTVKLVEQWLKSVQEKIAVDLSAGTAVPGWKLVEGKQGPRKWTNAAKVEEVVALLKIPKGVAFETTLLSPTQIEKAISEKKYKQLESYITRSDAKPIAVAESDKRPAVATKTMFTDLN